MALGPSFDPDEIRTNVIAGVVAIALIGAILWALGLSISLYHAALLLVAIIIIGFFTRRTPEITVGFVLMTIAIGAAFIHFIVPDWALSPFGRVHDLWVNVTGVNLALFDPIEVVVVTFVFVFISVYVKIRLVGEKKFARPAFDLTLARMTRYLKIYFTWGRLVIAFSIGAVIVALEQSAQLLGVLGEVMGEAPIVVSNLGAMLVGWLALGGDLPLIGPVPPFAMLTAVGFLVITGLILATAAAVRYEGSGPLSQVLRR